MKRDLLGKPITIGCLLAYPVRAGSSTYTSVIRVTGIQGRRVIGKITRTSGYGTVGRPVKIVATDRAVVVEPGDANAPLLRELATALLRHEPVPRSFLELVAHDYSHIPSCDYDAKYGTSCNDGSSYRLGDIATTRLKEAA